MRNFAITLIIILSFGLQQAQAQDISTPKRIGVLSIDLIEIPGNAQTITNVVRLAIQKESKHDVIGRYDIMDLLQGSGINGDSCFSQRCLQKAAERLNADLMITGTVELIGEKIMMTLRMYDAKSKSFVDSKVNEFVNMPNALQDMIEVAIADLLGFQKSEVLAGNLKYYNTMSVAPSTAFLNNGPRIGASILTGNVANRMMDSRENGGYGTNVPFMTQFGYQHEIQYMSAGSFQGLIELMAFVTGLEKSLFVPSAVGLLGFRDSKSGFEFGLGASVSVRSVEEGFFDKDNNNAWVRTQDWNEFDENGNLLPYPYPVTKQLDTRGDLEPYTRWIFSVGKTFRSGYLNIPVNVFASPMDVNDWMIGLSVGFNVRKRPKNKALGKPNFLD